LIANNYTYGGALDLGAPGISGIGRYNLVSNNIVRYPNGDGIFGGDCQDSLIIGNTIELNKPMLEQFSGIALYIADSVVVHGNKIGSTYETSPIGTGIGILLGNGNGVSISNNNINNFDSGVFLFSFGSPYSNFSITGNVCRDLSGASSGDSAIMVYPDFTIGNITGNHIDGYCIGGINVEFSEFVHIASNYISDYASFAISVDGSPHCSVVGNMGRAPYGTSGIDDVNGIKATNSYASLIAGNWMEALTNGVGVLIPTTFDFGVDDLLVASNLSTGGNVPADGAGATWASTGYCGTETNRYFGEPE
jgi:hypothetical protein